MNLYRMAVDQDEHYVMASDMALAAEAFTENSGAEPDAVSFVSDAVFVAGEEGLHEGPDEEHLLQKIERMEKAIRWALGEGKDDDGDTFSAPPRGPDKPLPPYWWRPKLRKMAGIEWER